MKYLKDTRIIIAILIVLIVIIIEVGKSIRIKQLKEIETSKIESMGAYEKNSKVDYLNTLELSKEIQTNTKESH